MRDAKVLAPATYYVQSLEELSHQPRSRVLLVKKFRGSKHSIALVDDVCKGILRCESVMLALAVSLLKNVPITVLHAPNVMLPGVLLI